MRWKLSWEAVIVGIGVWALWVGLDGLYPSLDSILRQALCPVAKHIGFEQWCASTPALPQPWNPRAQFSPAAAWAFVVVRIAGSTLVVPPLEELFYRSFLYRYLKRPDFETVPLNGFAWVPFLVSAGIFGLAHYEWLPGILCGMLYQALVLRRNRLGDAMTAHAITNLLLGLWVVWKGAWHFW
jgi:CAAX prenyl protease-like protein